MKILKIQLSMFVITFFKIPIFLFMIEIGGTVISTIDWTFTVQILVIRCHVS